MKTQRMWLRRAITIGAVAVLAALSLVTAGAGAEPPAGAPNGDAGVQEVKFVQFPAFDCTFQGEGQASGGWLLYASTSAVRGSNCPSGLVRAYVCASGSCWTTEWRSTTYYVPSGHQLRASIHKCSGCVLTHRINY